MTMRHADNGGLIFFRFNAQDVAGALVNPRLNTLLVLNVSKEHRGHGCGRAVVDYLKCNFARVVESAIPFFKSCGYVAIGEMKKGRSFNTQVMVRESLLSVAGRLRSVLSAQNQPG